MSVTAEYVWMCYAWDSVLSLVQWQCHQSLCQMLYDYQPGAKIPIPPCPEDTHPLHVFEETHVDRNLYRWVVFVLWLKAHPNAWKRRIPTLYPPYPPYGMNARTYGPSKGCLATVVEPLPRSKSPR